ncbi:MAG TPA: helix-turn-helix domain-containing protein, partial [Candidatus Thermoplasmatota archaeon]
MWTRRIDTLVEGPESVDSDVALATALKSLSHPKRLRLLRFATEPRTLEEIASHLKVARQSAKEHLDRLLEIGLLEPRSG